MDRNSKGSKDDETTVRLALVKKKKKRVASFLLIYITYNSVILAYTPADPLVLQLIIYIMKLRQTT